MSFLRLMTSMSVPFSLFSLFVYCIIKQLRYCSRNVHADIHLLSKAKIIQLNLSFRQMCVRYFQFIPSHVSLTQSRCSLNSPLQLWPPYWGTGSSHCLALVWVPILHVTEHSVQRLQSDQAPSTDKQNSSYFNQCVNEHLVRRNMYIKTKYKYPRVRYTRILL